METKKIVLLDNETEGHHLAFMTIFAETLVKLQYNVVVFYPYPDLVKANLLPVLNHEETNRIEFIKYKEPEREFKIWSKIDGLLNVLYKWKYVNRIIKSYEFEKKTKVDVVFFAWLDSYLTNYLHPIVLNLFFNFKWSGLYFHPKHMRYSEDLWSLNPSLSDVDICLSSSNCIGLAIHDEGIISHYSNRIKNNVVLFSEIADDTVPDTNCSIANHIKLKANGRIVIGMVGLEYHKGTSTLYRLSQIAPSNDFYFVFIGKQRLETYSETDKINLEKFYNTTHENIFFSFNPLREGAEYNAVFSVLDIPYLVYNNFASTSNRLTKASIFEKPVIASNRFCIADDVIRYGLGEVVEENNAEASLLGIIKIKNDIENGMYKDYLPFINYRKKHSKEALMEQFQLLLKNI